MEKWILMAPNGTLEFFPTNPNLANILGRTDFNFENFFPKQRLRVGVLTFCQQNMVVSPHFWARCGVG